MLLEPFGCITIMQIKIYDKYFAHIVDHADFYANFHVNNVFIPFN